MLLVCLMLSIKIKTNNDNSFQVYVSLAFVYKLEPVSNGHLGGAFSISGNITNQKKNKQQYKNETLTNKKLKWKYCQFFVVVVAFNFEQIFNIITFTYVDDSHMKIAKYLPKATQLTYLRYSIDRFEIAHR